MTPQPATTRIIALTHEFYPRRGGIATYVEEVARAARAGGTPIEVWAPADPALEHRNFPFTVRPMPVPGSEDWSCRLKLTAHLRRHRARWRDATVYLPEPGPLRTWMYLQLIGAWHPRRLVITLHGSEILRVSKRLHRRLLFGRLLGLADRIGVVSRYGREILLERFPEVATKVVVAPGAPRPGAGAAPGDGPSGGRLRLLTVGRIHPRKGQLEVVEALGALPAELRSRIELRLVGPTGRRAYLLEVLRTARRYRLRVRKPGSLDDDALAAEYRAADVFVMASVPRADSVEGFGLVYLEASASGLPVVGYRTGGVEDAIDDGNSGLLVNAGDRAGLARALERLAADPALRGRMGDAGRAWAARFSWSHTANLLFGP